jgi:Mce-associated membrane protein
MEVDADGAGWHGVTDPAVETGPAGTSWRITNVVLVLVALILIATTVILFTRGASATPGDSRAETLSRQHEDVTKAARDETTAFLTVDYKNMDPLIEKVLAGSSGTFKEQYSRAKVTLKASAQDSQAVSTGKVLSVGVADIDDSDAVVFVAANSQVTNSSTKGKAQPRYYRLKLTMVRKGDTWLTSNLQFVG